MSTSDFPGFAGGFAPGDCSGKATESPLYDRLRIAEMAEGVGDPQCYRGKAGGPARFEVGDRVRVKDLPDVFYNQTPGYTRGAVGTVVTIVYESPTPEDEAWGNLDQPEWFYSVCFRHVDLWGADDPEASPTDTVQAEMPERWLEPA
ncbi:MAG TPA: nitrile hydratase subunit beta [Thiobacillaceae bacterium]|nr:nitrile hydratase subunit beta [Thiobacillaceae bacterium]